MVSRSNSGSGPGAIPLRVDEESPLIDRNGSNGTTGGKSGTSSTARRLQRHLGADVTRNWADLVLLFCYIITGLLDSSAVFIWGAFVSMQTGNTIYFGLGIIAPNEGVRWVKSGVSIVSFCLGSFCFARFHRYFTPSRRWVLIVSYAFQALLIAVAASIVTWGEDFDKDSGLHWQVLVALSAVAFQGSGQTVTSRALEYNGLTSVVITTNYCDLFSDPNLFALHNVERNRRIVAPTLLLLGACAGGLFAHSSLGLAGALWTAVVLKSFAVIAWILWKTEAESAGE